MDVKDAAAFGPTLEVATAHGAAGNLWLCHEDLATLAGWRGACPESVLVHSTFVGLLDGGCERHAADLRAASVDAVNLHQSEWNAGRIALYRRFQRRGGGGGAPPPGGGARRRGWGGSTPITWTAWSTPRRAAPSPSPDPLATPVRGC